MGAFNSTTVAALKIAGKEEQNARVKSTGETSRADGRNDGTRGLLKSRVSEPIKGVLVVVEEIEGPNHHGLPAPLIAKAGG